MGKVRITIRCAKCYHVETQDIEAWGIVKSTCGCNGPYRVLSRAGLPDEPQGDVKEKKGAGEKGPKSSAAPEAAGAPENQGSTG